MRFFISGPRLFGGILRPGISFGMPRYASTRSNAAAIGGEYVYVVENRYSGHNKIGYSVDPQGNLKSLQRGSSVPLSLAFHIFAADRAFDVEQEAHAILDRRRLEGEWFDVSKDAAIASIYAAAARLNVPVGEDAMLKDISMERKIIAIVITAVITFVALSAMRGLPVEINQAIVGVTVAALLFRRWFRKAA
jgi:T5orf172 domain